MKLNVANVSNVVYCGSKVGEKTLKDGRKVPAYYMSMSADGDVGSLACSVEVFNHLSQMELYKPVTIICAYDSWEREMVVVKTAPAKNS